MNIIRYMLSGCSAVCFILTFISTIFFSSGFNLIAFILMLFFGMNAVYLFFMIELSQPSRLLKTLAGYFAFTALELEHRAKIAEKTESLKSQEKASKLLEDSKYHNDRLKAAEEFLKIITMAPRRHDAAVNSGQKQISNAQYAATAFASTKTLALSAPAQVPLPSEGLTSTAVKNPVAAALSEKVKQTQVRLDS